MSAVEPLSAEDVAELERLLAGPLSVEDLYALIEVHVPRLLADRKRLEKERDEARRLHGKLILDASQQIIKAKREAFCAGWWVNAANPDESGAGTLAYFDGCEAVDWAEYQKREIGLADLPLSAALSAKAEASS